MPDLQSYTKWLYSLALLQGCYDIEKGWRTDELKICTTF